MKEFKITCSTENGLHMRPAMVITDTASIYESDITIFCEGRQGSAKSIMETVMLTITEGEEIIVRAEGKDEEEAIQRMKEIFEKEMKSIIIEGANVPGEFYK